MAEIIPLILYETIRRELENSEVDGNFKSLRSAVAQFLLAGAAGVYVTGGYISTGNHVVFNLSNGSTIDFGTITLSSIYTKTETDARIAAIIGTAPANLDTLGEIAARLASDESVVGGLITTISSKAAAADLAAHIANSSIHHTHGNKSVLDGLSDSSGKILYNGQIIQGGGADPLSFFQTYGYVQVIGALDTNGGWDTATQTRINTLVALGIPSAAILVAVMTTGGPAALNADNAASTSAAGSAELSAPGTIPADNATSTSNAGAAELTPAGAIGGDNATSSSTAGSADLSGALPSDNATSTSTADSAELSQANALPSATIIFEINRLPSATIIFSNIH